LQPTWTVARQTPLSVVTHANLAERVEYVKTTTKKSIELASPELQKELSSLTQQIYTSLDRLVSLKSIVIEEPSPLLTEKSSYTIEELESLLASYHQSKAKREQLITVERDEEAIAKKSEQKANESILLYREIKENTERKLKLGLTIMANSLGWYLWKAQLPSQQSKIDNLTKQLVLIIKETELAAEKLDVDEKTFARLDQKIKRQATLIESLHKQTISARDQYTGTIGLDFMSRIQVRLLNQKIIIAEISEKHAELNLSLLSTLKSLAVHHDQEQTIKNHDFIEQLRNSKLIRKEISLLSSEWRESTTEERNTIKELLSSGYIKEENKEANKLIDQRISAIKDTLQKITKLEQSFFDLDQLTNLLEERLSKTEGWIFKLRTKGSHLFEHTGGRLWSLLNIKLFESEETHVTSLDLIQDVLILFATFYIARLLQKTLVRLNTSSDGKIAPAIYTLSRVIFYTIILIGIFIAFAFIGINFKNLAIIAGALSVGIGFGLQSVVNNFVSGIIILFEHNIKVGDFVKLESGLKGTIRDINVRATIINTRDNLDIIVPNSELVSAQVINFTLHEPISQV